MDNPGRIRRLQWHCRRGMKELDLLLERFLAVHGEALAAGCWPELETMLETEDDELWEWLQNPGTKRASPFHDLLERIRNVRQ